VFLFDLFDVSCFFGQTANLSLESASAGIDSSEEARRIKDRKADRFTAKAGRNEEGEKKKDKKPFHGRDIAWSILFCKFSYSRLFEMD